MRPQHVAGSAACACRRADECDACPCLPALHSNAALKNAVQVRTVELVNHQRRQISQVALLANTLGTEHKPGFVKTGVAPVSRIGSGLVQPDSVSLAADLSTVGAAPVSQAPTVGKS